MNKKFWILLIGIALCAGCTGKEPKIEPNTTPNISVSANECNWLQDKGYIDSLRFYPNTVDYQYSCTKDEIIFEYTDMIDPELKERITVNQDSSIIIFEFKPVEFAYQKENIEKTGTLSAQLRISRDRRQYHLSAELSVSDGQTFEISFDPDKGELQDNEKGAPTYGNKMQFTDSLYKQCLLLMQNCWNQGNVQLLYVLEAEKQHQYIVQGGSVNNISEAKVIVYDAYKDGFGRIENNMYPTEILYTFMGLEDDIVSSITEANPLTQTLSLAVFIESSFNDPSELDMSDIQPGIMSVTDFFGCTGHICKNSKGTFLTVGFGIEFTYNYAVPQAILNEKAKQILGIENVYQENTSKQLDNGFVYSEDSQSYIAISWEGDPIIPEKGLIILNQEEHEGIIKAELIPFQISTDQHGMYALGKNKKIKISDEFTGDEKSMEIVKANEKEMQHWIYTVKKNDDGSYQLISGIKQ